MAELIEHSVHLSWLILTLDLLARLWISTRIIRRRLPASVSWAWLSVTLFMPLFGTAVYLLFGEYRQSSKRQSRLNFANDFIKKMAEKKFPDSTMDSLKGHRRQDLALAFRSMMGMPAISGNSIELLHDSERGFSQLFEDMNSAKSAIDLEFYIWSDGGLADTFAQTLAAAAKRNVRCRLLVDAVGSAKFIRGPQFSILKDAGVEVIVALRPGFWRSIFARPDLRIHRKIVVIDREIGYTGSMNLADPKFFNISAGVGQWVDALAKIRGPAVGALHSTFLSDWFAETGENTATTAERLEPSNLKSEGSAIIQCLPSGPAVKDSFIEQILIMSLNSAHEEIILTTPYFIPGEALRYALISAALRGVKTTLILPEHVDSKMTHFASRSFLQDLVEAGVTVALYKPGLLHTKSITIDQEFSLFGSLNLDPRSFRINFEITVAVFDRQFAKDLCTLQDSYLAESRLYTKADTANQAAMDVWKGDLARLVGPLL